MASGIAASKALVDAIASVASRDGEHGRNVALVVRVNETETELVSDAFDGETKEALASAVCGNQEGQDAFYVLVKHDDGDGFLFVTHIPEDCTIRKKMIYASTQGKLKLTIGLESIARDIRTDSLGELEAELARGTEEDEVEAPLTEEETLLQRKNKVSHSAQNASYFEDRRVEPDKGSYLSVSEEVIEAARRTWKVDGETSSVVRVALDSKEKVVVDGREALGSSEQAAGALAGKTKTCFILAKGSDSGNPLVLLFCPDDATIRKRMVFSIATQSLQDSLRRADLAFDSVSVTTPSEAASALGLDKKEGEARGAGGPKAGQVARRPKRPGRGKRGLVAKPKD